MTGVQTCALRSANMDPAAWQSYLAGTQSASPQYTTYTPDQIANYIQTSGINVNDPTAVAAALKQANMDPAAWQSYLSNQTSTKPAAASTYTPYTPANIANYVSSSGINLNDPAAVASATKTANADPSVVAQYIASLNPQNTGTTTAGLSGLANSAGSSSTAGGISSLPTGTTANSMLPVVTPAATVQPSGANGTYTSADIAKLLAQTQTLTANSSDIQSALANQIAGATTSGGATSTAAPTTSTAATPAATPAAATPAAATPAVSTPAASAAYTQYTPSDIAWYMATNGINPQDPAQVAAAEKATNADPSVVNSYISSLPAPPDALQQAIAGASAASTPAPVNQEQQAIADARAAAQSQQTLAAQQALVAQQALAAQQAQAATEAAVTPSAPSATPPSTTDAITQIVSQGQAAGQSPAEMAATLMAQGISAADVIAVVGNADIVNQAYADASANNGASFGYDTAADGGLMTLHYAMGGATPAQPRYLQGHTDGMADELNTSIDGIQPAKLSHGEFVIPADVVSHLGNGNSDAGAKKLYEMMSRGSQSQNRE